jgi:hypothetical protein
MLEGIPADAAKLTAPRSGALPRFCRFRPANRCFQSADRALRQAAERASLEFSRSASRTFFAAVHRVAEKLRYGSGSAQQMNLKTVRLFFRARLGVDAPDVRFRIRIRSLFHSSLRFE